MTSIDNTSIQVYDKIRIREFIKLVPRIFWHSEVVVNTEEFSKECRVDIKVSGDFKVFVNGEEYVLKDNK